MHVKYTFWGVYQEFQKQWQNILNDTFLDQDPWKHHMFIQL